MNSRMDGSTYTGSTTVTRTVTRTYVVRSGDTVSAVANRLGLLPVSAWHVPSGNLNRIYVGQTITYTGSAATSTTSYSSSSHVVRSGESLWSIYGTGWSAAASRNGLHYPYTIYPGQTLR